MKKYADTHEWIETADGSVGISAYAVNMLGDIVFLELPGAGQTVAKGDAVAEIESVKSVSEIYAPVSGEVTAVNSDLTEAPESLNEDPETWLFKLAPSDTAEFEALMDADSYANSEK